jgi:hypothetical protein
MTLNDHIYHISTQILKNLPWLSQSIRIAWSLGRWFEPRLQDSSPRDSEQDPLAGGSVQRVGRQSESQGSLPNVVLTTLPVIGPLKCLGLSWIVWNMIKWFMAKEMGSSPSGNFSARKMEIGQNWGCVMSPFDLYGKEWREERPQAQKQQLLGLIHSYCMSVKSIPQKTTCRIFRGAFSLANQPKRLLLGFHFPCHPFHSCEALILTKLRSLWVRPHV